MLLGGEPGSGMSVALQLGVAHAALSPDCKLILIDGKRVELGMWRHCAEKFIGPSIDCLHGLPALVDERTDILLQIRQRNVTPARGSPLYLVAIDEVAYYSATVGTKTQQNEFNACNRDVVARGRAPGIIAIEATPAALGRHHSHQPARSVRLPVGVPVLHRRQLRHHPRPRHRRLRPPARVEQDPS